MAIPEWQRIEYPAYLIPHAEFGEPPCSRLLCAVPCGGGDPVDLECNDCGAIVKTVAAFKVTARRNREMQRRHAVNAHKVPTLSDMCSVPYRWMDERPEQGTATLSLAGPLLINSPGGDG